MYSYYDSGSEIVRVYSYLTNGYTSDVDWSDKAVVFIDSYCIVKYIEGCYYWWDRVYFLELWG